MKPSIKRQDTTPATLVTMFSVALGLAQQDAQGTPLAVYYPRPILAPNAEVLAMRRPLG